LVPVEPAGSVLMDHVVAVRDGKIEAVLPVGDARQRFAGYEQVALPEHVLIPGLVNAHTHAAMTLMRGLADDLPLMRWLEEHVWPAEKRHVSREFVRDGTLLACAEMLRGGITCFNDMYFFPDAALEASLAAGMRSALGLIAIEFPSAYASDSADYLRKGLAIRDRYRDHQLVSFCLAPHAPYSVSDATFRQVATLAAELDLPVHVHVHETADEIERSMSEHGVRPLERLRRLDLLQEMRTAALLAKAVSRDAEALPAHAALRAATLAGAQALGIAATTGSIEPGKAADLVAVSMSAPELAPCYDPVSHLVYAAGREHVTHVFVNGELRVRDGVLRGGAFSGLDTRWQLWQNALEQHKQRADS